MPMPVNVGDIVDKYRVESIIGIGAMGLVVAARHTTLDQIVAIKFLVEHRFGSREESIARFLGEARAAARIDSDHVCRVSDVGMLPSGVPYMIMEYLEGTDLEAEIVSRGQLNVALSVDYILQALDAIAAAHQLGVVHRDLKPANLFLALRPDGSHRVKVLDFGISKGTTLGKSRYTRETRSLGTPAYMPPEQIRDPMNVDHRADIWALGAILYELLTGQMAFVGMNVKEVLDRVLCEDPCPIEVLRRDVPPGLIAVIARALARDREYRWPSAAMFAQALAPFSSIGVLSGLASIQREVGSLSSISSLRASPPAYGGPLTTPSGAYLSPYAGVTYERISQTDPDELSRRHVLVQGWAASQTRRRRVRTFSFGAAAALLLFFGVALFAFHRAGVFGAPHLASAATSTSAESARLSASGAPDAGVVIASPGASSRTLPTIAATARKVQSASSVARPSREPGAKSPRRKP